MSYQLKIGPKSLNSARFISQLQKVIQSVFVESGLSQQQVAEKLDVDRSVINRRLKGSANLTARSIAEFAYAFDKDIRITFPDKLICHNNNLGTTNLLPDNFKPLPAITNVKKSVESPVETLTSVLS